MPFTPAVWRQSHADLGSVQGLPDLQKEFQESQGNKEKSCLEKQNNKQKFFDQDYCIFL